ncbi:MAG: 1-acyl-sn-glycerol-3-phosphate acyltransferase [Polyangiaceae bacterium]|nr:1-acyl-sn-glycerol-3-phosphate acyltransferase [Polyangiaceae bacterium]
MARRHKKLLGENPFTNKALDEASTDPQAGPIKPTNTDDTPSRSKNKARVQAGTVSESKPNPPANNASRSEEPTRKKPEGAQTPTAMAELAGSVFQGLTTQPDPMVSRPSPQPSNEASNTPYEVAERETTHEAQPDAHRDSEEHSTYRAQPINVASNSPTIGCPKLDSAFDKHAERVVDLLYDRYFRVSVVGAHHVPTQGRAMVLANHALPFPYDGVMLRAALRREQPTSREVRWMAEDHWFLMPMIGPMLRRMGALSAREANAADVLHRDQLLVGFPEGADGAARLYKDKHRLQRFARDGFVKAGLRASAPVVPCVIVGAEESMPMLYSLKMLARPMGMPFIPVTPTFPALGLFGLIPAPTKWLIVFGDPFRFDKQDPAAADNPALVNQLTARVRATMQTMLDKAYAARRSHWFG